MAAFCRLHFCTEAFLRAGGMLFIMFNNNNIIKINNYLLKNDKATITIKAKANQ